MGPEGGFFSTTGGHQLWVRQWGNPDGLPVLFLHGGPGSGCAPFVTGLFDETQHRLVLMDQRGAGKSLPHRSRLANTTPDLVADIEALRSHLGIESWLLVGGSWGATLALAYAQAHPLRVRALALRSVFLGTRAELIWAFDTGLGAFFPHLRAALLDPVAHEPDPLAAVWRHILHDDPAIHRPAITAFYRAERAMSSLQPDPDLAVPLDPPPATPLMEAHYFQHDCFLAPDQLINGAGAIAAIPGRIIQPLQDLLCPPATSARLAAVWPAAQRLVLPGAGHDMGQPQVFAALRAAVADLTRILLAG